MLKGLFLENKAKIGTVLLGMFVFLIFDDSFRQLLRVYPLVNTFFSALISGLVSAGVLQSDRFHKDVNEEKRFRDYVEKITNDRSEH